MNVPPTALVNVTALGPSVRKPLLKFAVPEFTQLRPRNFSALVVSELVPVVNSVPVPEMEPPLQLSAPFTVRLALPPSVPPLTVTALLNITGEPLKFSAPALTLVLPVCPIV